MNYKGSFLTITAVAVIIVCHSARTSANTALKIAPCPLHILTAVPLHSPLRSASVAGIEPSQIGILHLRSKRNVLANQGKQPLPPRPEQPGGSR